MRLLCKGAVSATHPHKVTVVWVRIVLGVIVKRGDTVLSGKISIHVNLMGLNEHVWELFGFVSGDHGEAILC